MLYKFASLDNAKTPEPLRVIGEVINSLEIHFLIIHDSYHVEFWWK
jgi:hypothetical protein